MLALWSRASRNPSPHRYIQCVPNTTAVSRRAGSVNVKGLWAFGTPTSTFVYTTIFAAGIAIDGKIKHDRNDQWNTAFDQLREEIVSSPADVQSQEELQTSTHVATSAERAFMENDSITLRGYVAPEELFPDSGNWEKIHQIAGTELFEDRVSHTRQIDLTEDLWELLKYDSIFPDMQALDWSVNTGPYLIQHHLPPQSLWSYSHVRRSALRRRQTQKKLVTQELCIGILIQTLLNPARNCSWEKGDLEGLSPAIQTLIALGNIEAKTIRFKLRKVMSQLQDVSTDDPEGAVFRLRNLFMPPLRPQYFQDDDGDFYDTCQQMNVAIRKLLDGKKPSEGRDMSLVLVKLCHNLLESSAAPNVQTFNALITGLKRWRMTYLVDEVISAFEFCKIRPNEITCATILDYYIKSNRPDKFSMFVAKMRGMQNALMLANPSINVNEASASRLVRAHENKIYQKVHPTPIVFNTIMLGVLKFAGIERTLEIYHEMKQDGWGLDVPGLTHLLADCVYRADWQNGLHVWGELASVKGHCKPRESDMETIFSYMLSLCSVTQKPAMFNYILKDAIKRGFNQKDVVSFAGAITRKARGQQLSISPDQVSTAPAWTADNMLIAAAGDIEEGSSSQKEPTHGLVNAELWEPDTIAPPEPDVTPSSQAEPTPNDPETTWSTWVAYELGEQVDNKPD